MQNNLIIDGSCTSRLGTIGLPNRRNLLVLNIPLNYMLFVYFELAVLQHGS
jgi:hypothetical protein